jgi:hypothetical protein
MTRPLNISQAIRLIQDQSIFKLDLTDDALHYIAAWLVCKQGQRDEEILHWALRHLERWVGVDSQVTLKDVIQSEMFELGEFYQEEDCIPYVRRFHETLNRLGIDPDQLPTTISPVESSEHLDRIE